VKLTHLHLLKKLRMSKATYLLLLHTFQLCTRTVLLFYQLLSLQHFNRAGRAQLV
jgi:hypothetical protein